MWEFGYLVTSLRWVKLLIMKQKVQTEEPEDKVLTQMILMIFFGFTHTTFTWSVFFSHQQQYEKSEKRIKNSLLRPISCHFFVLRIFQFKNFENWNLKPASFRVSETIQNMDQFSKYFFKWDFQVKNL